MRMTAWWMRVVSMVLAVLLAVPLPALAQNGGEAAQSQTPGGGEGSQEKQLSKEELAQLVAPIALYPDELVTQILMASTYPLEIVQADRWVKKNKDLKGDKLATALEKEKWDPSVKSLVNFPSVLAAMSEKLDQTTKLGDAFLSQQKDVMDTIQLLRKKAYDAGNLKTTKEQKIVVEQETIVIKAADPQVIYVPSYSPTVVYGGWPYPAYPPYYYYPPPPPAYPAFHFAAGVAVGVAWGYAWGNANWHGGSVNYNVNQNININNSINRSNYQNKVSTTGKGNWQHDSSHRQGVAYKDNKTAQKYGQSSARTADASRGSRGYGDSRGSGAGARPDTGMQGGRGGSVSDRSAGAGGGRDSAFSGGSGSGSKERAASDRGSASRQSASNMSHGGGGGASRPSGGFSGGGGGGSRPSGGGGGGGGGSRGGGGGGSRGGGGGGRR